MSYEAMNFKFTPTTACQTTARGDYLNLLAERLEEFNRSRTPDGYEHVPMQDHRQVTADLTEAIEILRFSALVPYHQAMANIRLREHVKDMRQCLHALKEKFDALQT